MVSKSERRYRRHRFPIEVVEQCVWLYFRFAVSYSDIEEMMAKRGIQVTYETVREWCHKFGSLYAAQLRTKRARVGMKWHMDEVFLKMNGVQHYLWRAVDQNGAVIDIWCNRDGTAGQLCVSFASCSIPHAEHRASSLRTSYGATLLRKE